MQLHLQRFAQKRGSVEISVAMNLSVTQKPGILQSGNQAQNASLFAKLQVILKSHQVVGVSAKIFAAKLYDCVRNFPCAWISESYRLHRAEAQRIATTAGDLFNREAAFEVIELFPFCSFD